MNPYKTFGAMLLAIAVLCGPLVGEMQSEKLYFQLINRLQHDLGLEISQSEFKSGYLRSVAFTQIRIYPQPPYFDRPMDIGLDTRISHGLLGIEAVTTLQLSPQQQRLLAPYIEEQHPFELGIDGGWLGDLKISLHTARIEYASEPDSSLQAAARSIEIEPLDLEADIDEDWRQFTLSGNWQGMKIREGGKSRFQVGALKLVQNSLKHTDYLWLGDSEVDVDSLGFSLQGENYEFRDLQLLSSTTVEDQRIDSLMQLDSDSLWINEKPFPGHHLEINLKELQVAEFDQLLQTLDEIQRTPLSQDPHYQAQQQIEHYQRLTAAASKLLNKGFLLEIPQLELTLPQGRIEVTAKLRQPPTQGDDLSNSLLASTLGELDIRLPAALLNARHDKVADLLQKKWLVRQGDDYLSHANLEHMMLRVNGREYPLPPLL